MALAAAVAVAATATIAFVAHDQSATAVQQVATNITLTVSGAGSGSLNYTIVPPPRYGTTEKYNDVVTYTSIGNVPNLDVIDAMCGGNACVARKGDGTGYAWGDASMGGDSSGKDLGNVTKISCGDNACIALKKDGTAIAWGDATFGGSPNADENLTNVATVGCGAAVCFAVRIDKTATAWGFDPFGADTSTVTLTNVDSMACGSTGCLALKTDSTAEAWGTGGGGGDISSVENDFNLTNVAGITCGAMACGAYNFDGTAATWGDQSQGGDSSGADLTGVTYIECGGASCIALKSDNTAQVWGTYGVANFTNVATVGCGGYTCFAIKRDATAEILGDSDASGNASGVDLTNVKSISCGESACAALKLDHTAVVWGLPDQGGAADGIDLTNILSISCGGAACVAVRRDGTAESWGDASRGGDDSSVNLTPTDSFGFYANDGTYDSNVATVYITIKADHSVAAVEQSPAIIPLSAIEVSGNNITFHVVSGPHNGTVTINGTFATYTSTSDVARQDTFGYVARDGTNKSPVVTVNIEVSPVNDAPVAINIIYTPATYNEVIAIPLLATDPEGSHLTYSVVQQADNGVVSISGNVATYTPTVGKVFDADYFTYAATDSQHAMSAAVIVHIMNPAIDTTYPLGEVYMHPQASPGKCQMQTNGAVPDYQTHSLGVAENKTHCTKLFYSTAMATYPNAVGYEYNELTAQCQLFDNFNIKQHAITSEPDNTTCVTIPSCASCNLGTAVGEPCQHYCSQAQYCHKYPVAPGAPGTTFINCTTYTATAESFGYARASRYAESKFIPHDFSGPCSETPDTATFMANVIPPNGTCRFWNGLPITGSDSVVWPGYQNNTNNTNVFVLEASDTHKNVSWCLNVSTIPLALFVDFYRGETVTNTAKKLCAQIATRMNLTHFTIHDGTKCNLLQQDEYNLFYPCNNESRPYETVYQTTAPSLQPTSSPTTASPTFSPTAAPTQHPTAPTAAPTATPTPAPHSDSGKKVEDVLIIVIIVVVLLVCVGGVAVTISRGQGDNNPTGGGTASNLPGNTAL